MANGRINFGKQSGGTLGLVFPDGATNTEVTLPESGILATTTYVDGKMVLATAVTASGTAIDFTGIPSWAKRITIMLNGVSTNGTNQVLVQLGTSSGISSTGYTSTAVVTVNGSTPAGTTNNTGLILEYNRNASSFNNGVVSILNISNNKWVSTGNIDYLGISTTCSSIGTKDLTGTLDRVRITTVNGADSFDAGSINIMYEG